MLKRIFRLSNYYRSLLLFYLKYASRQKKFKKPASFSNLLDSIGNPNKIIIVASGPSANKLIPRSDNLYIATNASYKLIGNHPMIYAISDNVFVTKYIATGIPGKGVKGVIFRFNKSDNGHMKIFKKVEKYFRISRSKVPELALTNFQSPISNTIDFEVIEKWTQTHLNMAFKQQNSGMFILLLGYFIANQLRKDIQIYGLDAGVGGIKHFDNKGLIGQSVYEDKVKKNLEHYLKTMYSQKTIKVENFSFFHPNT